VSLTDLSKLRTQTSSSSMATARPTVTVYNGLTGEATGTTLALPQVLSAPIRSDITHFVFRNMAKNHRQANGVAPRAGHMTSAESWGTGRAVARIPRVSGGGTHRSGQGAFGNMCRGGHMFAPKVIWRRWHRPTPLTMKRYAVASALAATAVPALVMARGHRITGIQEVPLVVSVESLATVSKTKQAVEVLKKLGAWADIERVIASHKLRTGKGKLRNRRYVQRRGPLIVYKEKGTLLRAFRNIPGIELCHVSRLNLLQLAPGNHLGRFVIWTSDAFAELDNVYARKKGFHMPHAVMTNTDFKAILQNQAVAAALRPRRVLPVLRRRTNPLRNFATLVRLNPYAATTRRAIIVAQLKRAGKYAEPPAKKPKKEGFKPIVHKPKPKKEKKEKRAAPLSKKQKLEARKAYKKANAKARKALVQALFA